MNGFQTKIVKVITSDGRNFALLEPVQYIGSNGTIYVMPEGAQSDGASTPQEMWSIIPPFGDYWLAAYLHDCAYRNTLKWTDGSKCNLSKQSCDNLLKEAMQSLGCSTEIVDSIFEGVVLGGNNSFSQDRT